jgi:hypothetical protein
MREILVYLGGRAADPPLAEDRGDDGDLRRLGRRRLRGRT